MSIIKCIPNYQILYSQSQLQSCCSRNPAVCHRIHGELKTKRNDHISSDLKSNAPVARVRAHLHVQSRTVSKVEFESSRSRVQQQLSCNWPPLSILANPLMSSLKVSRFAEEAGGTINSLVSSWNLKSRSLKSMQAYQHVGLDFCKLFYPNSTSAERLAAISNFVSVLFLIDDICFDDKSRSDFDFALASELGIDPSIWIDPSRTKSFAARLVNLCRSTHLPDDSVLIEKIWWDTVGFMERLSGSESYFRSLVYEKKDYLDASQDLQDHMDNFEPSLELGCDSRCATRGFRLENHLSTLVRSHAAGVTVRNVVFTDEVYLSNDQIRDPTIRRMFFLVERHASFVNEVLSFHKETEEMRPDANFVLMAYDGLSIQESMRRTMELANSDFHEFLEIKRKLPSLLSFPVNPSICRLVDSLEAEMAGNFFFHVLPGMDRYRTVDNPYSELRCGSRNSGSKILEAISRAEVRARQQELNAQEH
ncbi:hypothetical protein R1flu_015961 [Riccia fluitans]|uniref:Terpene synthase n=1 Tax=Riccia fluitans TaxID=41844 RepID=A0ABD1YKU7_9MARC